MQKPTHRLATAVTGWTARAALAGGGIGGFWLGHMVIITQ